MTQEALKKMCQLLLTEPHAPTVCAQLERIAREALADHAMQEVQRLGQEIEPDDIASILACRDMLDAQPVPPQRKPLTDEQIFALENSIPDEIVSDRDWCIYFARAIEAAHGIKETK